MIHSVKLEVRTYTYPEIEPPTPYLQAEVNYWAFTNHLLAQ